MSKYILLPSTYQPDTADTRKELAHVKYVKMYSEEYVKELIQTIDDLSEGLHGAIQSSSNRGTQRASIPLIKKGYKAVREWKVDK